MKDGYKDTLFGKLPDTWNISKIKDITVEHKQGYFTKEPYVNDGIYLARVTDLKNPLIDFSDMPKLNISNKDYEDFKICKDDFLFARSGAIGRYGIFENDTKPAIFGSYIIRFRFDLEFVVNRYIGYFYESSICRQQLKSISQGNANVNINAENIKSLNLPIPPLTEQQKIADILTTVDEKLENIESQIAEYTNLKTGLMQQLLTKGIGHTNFVDSELGMIPEGWRVVKLKEIVKFNNGKAHEGCVDESGNYIIVNSKFISTEGKTRKYTNENLCPLRKGDIALVMSDIPNGKAIAKCFIVKEDNIYTLNQRICSISPINGISEYLFYILNRNKYYLQFDNGVSQTNLRKDEVLECPILFPPIAEQMKIADILSTIDIKLESLQQKKEEFTNLKKGLMEQLLTGRIRVKV